MILTTCAACAAPLAHNAPRCVRCKLRLDEAVEILRKVHSGMTNLHGEFHAKTLNVVLNLAGMWVATSKTSYLAEAKVLLRRVVPEAQRTFGPDHDVTLKFRRNLALALLKPAGASQGDLQEAKAIFDDVVLRSQRALGPSHPTTVLFQHERSQLRQTRA